MNFSNAYCVFLAFVGLIGVLIYIIDFKVNQRIYENFVSLDEGRSFRSQWIDPDVKMALSTSFFNLSQIDDGIYARETKPFVFHLDTIKTNISETPTRFTFVPVNRYKKKNTSYSLTNKVSTLNVPLLTIMNWAEEEKVPVEKYWPDFKSKFISPFVFQEAHNLLFDGYTDQLLQTLFELQQLFDSISHLNKKFLKEPKFAFFLGKNESSSEGEWTVHKGHFAPYRTGQLISWNGLTKTDYYNPGSSCNIIRGSNGEKFPHNLDINKKIYLFVTDFCTPIPFKFVRQTETFGRSTYRYEFSFGDSSHNDTDERCFAPNGLHNVAPCNNHAPIFLTSPHFADTQSNLTNKIHGLNENTTYKSFIEIEPISGVAMRASLKFQINLLVRHSSILKKSINFTENLFLTEGSDDQILVPLLLVNLKAEIGSEGNKNLSQFILLFYTLPILFFVLYIILVIPAFVIIYLKLRTRIQRSMGYDERQPFVVENDG